MFIQPTGTYQFLDPTSFHSYQCKKGIPHSQTLRPNIICSDNTNFDKNCKYLEK